MTTTVFDVLQVINAARKYTEPAEVNKGETRERRLSMADLLLLDLQEQLLEEFDAPQSTPAAERARPGGSQCA